MGVGMSAIDECVANNRAFAAGLLKAPPHTPPAKHIAVVICMDARLNTWAMLGLGDGDAHVIRNAGGVVTDDVIRSLTISQRLLGTSEIMLIHHTDCGMLTFTDDDLKQQILEDTGIKPPFAMEAFTDLIRLPELKHAAWAYLAGFLAGILGGAYNTSGPPVIIYGHSKRWPTAEFKSNLQAFFVITSLIIVLGHAWNQNFSPTIWGYFLWSIPAMIFGIIAGIRLDKYIKPEIFRRVVLFLLLIMGMRLIFA